MAIILPRKLPGVPVGQATADIHNIYYITSFANASVVKYAKQQGSAQAQARMKGIVPNAAQAQATIT